MDRHPLVVVITYVTFSTLLTLSVSCLAAVGWSLWTRRSLKVRDALAESANQAFLLGLINVLAYFLVIALMQRAGLGGIVTPILIMWTAAMLVSGLPGALALLGERLLSHAAGTPSTLRRIFIGTWVFGLACMVPVAGWLLLLGFLLTALGGSLMVFLRSLSAPDPHA